MPFTVTVIESERSWGSKVDQVREFDNADDAWDYYNKINDKNTLDTVPDLYWYATEPEYVDKRQKG